MKTRREITALALLFHLQNSSFTNLCTLYVLIFLWRYEYADLRYYDSMENVWKGCMEYVYSIKHDGSAYPRVVVRQLDSCALQQQPKQKFKVRKALRQSRHSLRPIISLK